MNLLHSLFPNRLFSNIGFDSRYNLYHHRIVFFCHSLFYTRSQSYLFLRLHLFINSPIRIRYSRTQLNAFIYSAVCTCERASENHERLAHVLMAVEACSRVTWCQLRHDIICVLFMALVLRLFSKKNFPGTWE